MENPYGVKIDGRQLNPIVHKDCLVWASKKQNRMRAFDPDITSSGVAEKILFRMDGDIRNHMKVLI